MVQYLGTGRRKRSVARGFLRPGQGNIQVNGKPLDSYFPTESLRVPVKHPLLATETADKFDVLILANGGGVAGQAGCASRGSARPSVGVYCGGAAEVATVLVSIRQSPPAPA